MGQVGSAAASKVNLIVLRPSREAIGTTTVVIVLVLVPDSQPTIKFKERMAAPELTVVDVRRAFLLPLTKGAQAGVPLVEDKLNKTHSLTLDGKKEFKRNV